MQKVNFLFGIHNHQPVGNFDGVFEDSFKRSYMPFLEVLASHPGIRISLHTSGPLFDWAKQKCPEYIDRVGELHDKKQIELLGGGYYEPLLSVIPQEDAIGQIHMMRDFLKSTFGSDSQGIWLTERVWEPLLPDLLYRAGIKFTIIDESHFRSSGISSRHITGYYNTEKYGNNLSIFPISKKLRYAIPFKLPHETTDLLREIASEAVPVITYGDDGEKFGIWPHTHKWVFEEKWLHNFFEEVEKNSDWINMPTFSELLEEREPSGRIYLPTASYSEMMEWALPPDAALNYKKIITELNESGKKEQYEPFIRGGIWSNFLSKYPESNQMYKRSLLVSKRLQVLSEKHPNSKEIEKARAHLYKSQCNCAYWHGLFGGVYLNYLRHAIYQNIIDADRILDGLDHSGHKFWCDQSRINFFDRKYDEIVLNTRDSTVIISPGFGASLTEFDYKPKSFNLSNVISRRRESYHDDIEKIMNEGVSSEGSPKSIHDICQIKDKRITGKLIYDSYPKFSFIEHYIPAGTSLDQILKNNHTDLKDPVVTEYNVGSISSVENRRAYIAKFSQEAILKDTGKLKVEKSFELSLKESSINVRYTLANPGPEDIKFLFALELNLTLLAGKDKQRYLLLQNTKRLGLSEPSSAASLEEICLIDEWSKFKVTLHPAEKMDLVSLPLETVSQSESGFELTYQGTTLLFIKELQIKPENKREIALLMRAEEI